MQAYFYAQLDAAGVVVSVLQLAAATDTAGMVPLQTFDDSLVGMRYLPASRTFEPVPPAEPAPVARRISSWAFRRRFTAAERAGIEWAAVDRADDTPPQRRQAAALRSRLKDQESAAFIDLDDPDVIEGAHGMEALGLIAPGRAQQILTSPIDPKELP